MDISKVTISCVKSECPGAASLHQSRCGVCLDPIVKRYLRVLHPPEGLLKAGELIEERYWVTEFPNIVLDTQPQDKPILTDEISPDIEGYLKLSPHMLHVPQVFGLLTAEGGWLLEYPSVTLEASGLPLHPDLFASILEVWQSAEPLQQLNWLAQIAALLPDSLKQGAAGTFYDLSLLGINGGVVQIRQLLFDRKPAIDFKKLGQVWKELLEHSHKSIRNFCQKLHQALIQGKINQPQLLISVLDAGIFELGRSQYEFKYRVYTQTHSGPSRDHNEDACFPEAGRVHQNATLAIVCDGIGGHDQGEVASAIAIETLRKQLTQIAAHGTEATTAVLQEQISEAVLRTNDAISDRNDDEHREDRKRMGTTVVMAWARIPDLYLTHVGDSRIYRITTESCHQITYDDDLGSREVRLGYALYQDALQYPSSGALVQALGMSPSHSLHPTVTRVIPDQDTVYLLCSDGLSDYGRVDGHWQGEIAPLLHGQRDLPQVGERLIGIANTENGHDNATIAILHVQVKHKEKTSITAIAFPDLEQLPAIAVAPDEPEPAPIPVTEASAPPPQRTSNYFGLIVVGLFCVTGIGGLLWSMWQRSQRDEQPPEMVKPPIKTPVPISTTPETPPIRIPDSSPEPEVSPLTTNQILRLKPDATLTGYATPEAIATPDAETVLILGESILRVDQINDQNQVMLELCQAPTTTATLDEKLLSEKNRTWTPMEAVVEQLDDTFIVEEAANPCSPDPN